MPDESIVWSTRDVVHVRIHESEVLWTHSCILTRVTSSVRQYVNESGIVYSTYPIM